MAATGLIDEIRFDVADPAALAPFYGNVLGFDVAQAGRDLVASVPAQGTRLRFCAADVTPASPEATDLYWKIGLTLRDLDHAVAAARGAGAVISTPRQFRDIGYLCHLRDPAGLGIELLQQGFAGRAAPAGPGHPVMGQGILAHLTLRARNLQAAQDLLGRRMGMRLISVQPVRDLGFTLYFYTWSDAALPDPDLTAVGNREWLWRLPDTLIELQHLDTPGPALRLPGGGQAGLSGLWYRDRGGGVHLITPRDLAPLAG
ncbi:MAG: VOC family protein [Marinibacterium sp.]|nr:VOC family protein [Marinibacterium sp.]